MIKRLAKWLLSLVMCAYHRRRSLQLACVDNERNERDIEYSYALSKLRLAPGQKALDVGPGQTAFPSILQTCGYDVTAIDIDPSVLWGAPFNPHFAVCRDDITRSKLSGERFDLVTCVSVVEHMPNADAGVREMIRVLKPQGIVILSFPYCESHSIENVYALEGCSVSADQMPYICRVYCREDVNRWTSSCSLKMVDQAYYKCWDGSYWRFGRRLPHPEAAAVCAPHDLTCIVLRKLGTR